MTALALSGCSTSRHIATPTDSAPAATPVARASMPAPTSAAPTTPSRAQLQDEVSAKLKAIVAKQRKGAVSVAALNTATGVSYSYGSTSGMWTASVYKLFVLEALLQKKGGPLTGSQADLAKPMIEQSVNEDGYSLFLAAGGRPGLIAAARKLGLKHTVPGHADPALTATSAPDMIVLLKNLVQPGRLTASARKYALNLMRNVESDQRWGVGVVADSGDDFANKNGWMDVDNTNGPGEDDNGLWIANSVGIVTINHQQVLMAVMTRHQRDFATGKKLNQQLARAIRPAVAS